ncbi:MAG TPA: pyrimidine utilization protein B [Gammaproteobacteria bacterium]|nr:pyrimidine utilization protein B [Gammaproteobacteria bacterium]
MELSARPVNIHFELNHSAVIVVDMQNAFAKPGGTLDLHGSDIAEAAAVIKVNEKLLAAARKANVKVIYLAMTYQPDLADAGDPTSPNYHKELGLKLMRERPELAGKLLIDGTWDWQIVDELTPESNDLLIRKPRYSGFVGTDLDGILRTAGIRFLFFTGIATNVCVESTARDAFFGEYWPILIEDAMTHTGPDFCRDATLWNCENLFGWVSDAASVIAAFNEGNR